MSICGEKKDLPSGVGTMEKPLDVGSQWTTAEGTLVENGQSKLTHFVTNNNIHAIRVITQNDTFKFIFYYNPLKLLFSVVQNSFHFKGFSTTKYEEIQVLFV